MEINSIISNSIAIILEEYATKLMNGIITNAEINAFCVKGICYYITCENNNNCKVLYCKYYLLTNMEECSLSNSAGNLYRDLLFYNNKIPQISSKIQTSSDNSEDNNINLINRLLQK